MDAASAFETILVGGGCGGNYLISLAKISPAIRKRYKLLRAARVPIRLTEKTLSDACTLVLRSPSSDDVAIVIGMVDRGLPRRAFRQVAKDGYIIIDDHGTFRGRRKEAEDFLKARNVNPDKQVVALTG